MRLTVLAHIRIMAVAKCSSSTTPCTFPSIPLLTRLTVFARFSVEAYYGALFHKKSEPKSVVRQFPRVLQYSRALVLMRLTVLAHMQGYLMAAAMCSQGFILVSACYMVASSYHASYSIRACHLTHVGLSISLQEIWTLEHSPCFTSPAEVKDRVSCRQRLTLDLFHRNVRDIQSEYLSSRNPGPRAPPDLASGVVGVGPPWAHQLSSAVLLLR